MRTLTCRFTNYLIEVPCVEHYLCVFCDVLFVEISAISSLDAQVSLLKFHAAEEDECCGKRATLCCTLIASHYYNITIVWALPWRLILGVRRYVTCMALLTTVILAQNSWGRPRERHNGGSVSRHNYNSQANIFYSSRNDNNIINFNNSRSNNYL